MATIVVVVVVARTDGFDDAGAGGECH
jgi:hypothetical protein